MSKRQSEQKPMSHSNCIVVEREKAKLSAKSLVKKKNERDKGKTFIRIPIFRGYIEREVK